MIFRSVLPTLLSVSLLACGRSAASGIDASDTPPGLLYGRITTTDGSVHEGRLRWGGDEEALWSNYFNGVKSANPWATHVPRERLKQVDLGRPFMARFGEIARIEPRGRDIQIVLKSGTVAHLHRYSADDLADGVRVWDSKGAVTDIGEWRIRTIEFLPTPDVGAAVSPLYGTVHTQAGDFTGLVQWNRKASLGADWLEGKSPDGRRRIRFDTIRSIARHSLDSSLVTLLDGSQVVLSGSNAVAQGNAGTYVDDTRFGRVLVSWEAFERVDFTPAGAVPDYASYPQGRPLAGTVVTRSGRRIAGRLVFDLDESETTETLDAPARGIDYTIPFGLIASIQRSGPVTPEGLRERVTLLSGEVLQLEQWGDLSERNGGMLIFLEGRDGAEHVPWADVARIEFDRAKTQASQGGSGR